MSAFFQALWKVGTGHAAALATVLAACIAGVFKLVEILGGALNNWLTELRARDRELWDYLEKSLQDYYASPNLLQIVHDLRLERADAKYVSKLDSGRLRELPAFLERIGIYLYTRQGTTRSAYRPFAEAVLLCDESKMMWPDDERAKAFWIAFGQFAAATKRQGYYLSEKGDVKFDTSRKRRRGK
jgi:hypothetical protein